MKAFAERVPSPCIGVCQLDPTAGLCVGCLRTVAEIAGWRARSDEEKREILRRIARRGGERSGR